MGSSALLRRMRPRSKSTAKVTTKPLRSKRGGIRVDGASEVTNSTGNRNDAAIHCTY